jgi:hypothetical protein
LWHALHGWRQEIAVAMITLGVAGPIGLADMTRLIAEHDSRPERLS